LCFKRPQRTTFPNVPKPLLEFTVSFVTERADILKETVHLIIFVFNIIVFFIRQHIKLQETRRGNNGYI